MLKIIVQRDFLSFKTTFAWYLKWMQYKLIKFGDFHTRFLKLIAQIQFFVQNKQKWTFQWVKNLSKETFGALKQLFPGTCNEDNTNKLNSVSATYFLKSVNDTSGYLWQICQRNIFEYIMPTPDAPISMYFGSKIWICTSTNIFGGWFGVNCPTAILKLLKITRVSYPKNHPNHNVITG